jgi:hypothetical protein
LDIWLCRQTTMPVPFDSNKPSFSIACLRKLRVGTFQANLPCHPYPFVLSRWRKNNQGLLTTALHNVCHLSEWIADIFVWIWLMLAFSVHTQERSIHLGQSRSYLQHPSAVFQFLKHLLPRGQA